MEPVVVASSVHESAGKLIDYYDLAVLDDIVYILLHDAVGLERLVYVVQKRHVLGVHQVLDAEVSLSLGYAGLCYSRGLRLLIHDVVSLIGGVGVLLGLHLYHHMLFKGLGELVRALIEIGGLVALSGYDKRSPCLVYEYRVHLVNYREGVSALNPVLLVNYHVVP